MYDLEKLLESPRFRRRISKWKLKQYSGPRGEDLMLDDINNKGTGVLTICWEGGFPGCSGAIYITKFQGFYFFDSSDTGSKGPFESLDEALSVSEFEGEMSCSRVDGALSLRRLKAFARGWVSEGETIMISGELFERRNGRLRHVSAKRNAETSSSAVE